MPLANSLGFRNNNRVALLVLAAVLGNIGSASAGTWNPGDLTTFPQGSWGGDPGLDAGAAILVDKFDTVYGSAGGVIVGSPSGFVMVFTDAPPVLAYIPSIGPPGPLNGSVVNPDTTPSGTFGGEVLALQFNVDFSDRGLLPGSSGLRFGDLVLTGFPLFSQLQPLNGLTVRQFLGVENTLLGGGSSIVTINDLGFLPSNMNGSFFNGEPSQFAQDHLVAPPVVIPEPSGLVLWGLGLLSIAAGRAAPGIRGLRRSRGAQ